MTRTLLGPAARQPRPSSTATRKAIYWRETLPFDRGAPLMGDLDTDVCLIGGGYTSLWTAIGLRRADPRLRISILERDYVGFGASGHNDGFVTPTLGHSLSSATRAFGFERAKTAYLQLARSIAELSRFCQKNDIDAEIEESGFCLIATTPAQVRRLEHDIRLAENFGSKMVPKLLSTAEVRERVPSPSAIAGIDSGGLLINPFKLVRGLADHAVANGVDIYEGTTALSVADAGDRVVVATNYGSVNAGSVVFATNAYQHQFPQFVRSLAPVWSYALVTEPLTCDQLAALHWPTRHGFVEARNFIVFMRLTADDRILIGGGPATYKFNRSVHEKHVTDDRIETILVGELARLLPAARGVRFSHFYGGPIAMTRDLVPHVGRIGSRTFFAHGFCGNGISSTHYVGKVLRDVLLDQDTSYSRSALVTEGERLMPGEPVLKAASGVVTGYLAAQDRRPDLIRWPSL